MFLHTNKKEPWLAYDLVFVLMSPISRINQVNSPVINLFYNRGLKEMHVVQLNNYFFSNCSEIALKMPRLICLRLVFTTVDISHSLNCEWPKL